MDFENGGKERTICQGIAEVKWIVKNWASTKFQQ